MFNIFIPLGKLSSFSVNLGQKLVIVSHLTKRSFFLTMAWLSSIKNLFLTFSTSLDLFLQAFSAQMDALTKFVSLRHIWSHPTSLALCINECAHNTDMCKFIDVWWYKCSWSYKCRCGQHFKLHCSFRYQCTVLVVKHSNIKFGRAPDHL